jgi:hypothetical protein
MTTNSISRAQPSGATKTIPLGITASVVLTLCAIALWGVSLSQVNLSRMDDYGLMSVLPWTFYAAFILLTIGFALALHQPQLSEPILLLDLGVLILFIHGTPQLLYGTLRYAWAWKHIGVVEFIQRHGSIDPNVDAYHNWPGFFALGALFTDAAGLDSALGYAGWGPAFFNLVFVGALLMIFKTLTTDRRLVWLGVWFFALTNWIGQDYFSPQAFGYFLYLIVIGICLAWFRVTTPPGKLAIKRWVRLDRLASRLRDLFTRALNSAPPGPPSHPYQRVGMMMIVLPILGVVAASHQLTPFMMISALAALVVLQITTTRNLPLLMVVFTGTWMLYLAEAFLRGNLYWVVDSIGQLFQVSSPDLVDISIASRDQAVVAIVGRVFTAFVGLLALLGGIRRLRAGYWDLAAITLIVVPFAMLVANSYGGEMLFRSYFFALPFLAFFAGALLQPRPAAGASGWRTAATILLSGALFVGLLFAYYGKERMYFFTRPEVAAAQYLYDGAPKGSIFVSVTWDYPSLFHNYEYYRNAPICCGSKQILPRGQATLVADLLRLMKSHPVGYVIFSRGQRAHVEMIGLMPLDQLAMAEQTIRQSTEFRLVYQNSDAEIYAWVNPGGGVGK